MIKRWLARRRLARMVAERANSFEIRNYRKNREAQLKRRKK
jgi:hypothetical protein